jgi:hypothetical protein
MDPVELVQNYMLSFYGERSLESMKSLLAEDLVFKGPFFEFNSAGQYLESLKTDPPKDVKYEILKTYQKDNSVCLIYKFFKPGVETLMAQTFDINRGKIAKIYLIFDTKAFT